MFARSGTQHPRRFMKIEIKGTVPVVFFKEDDTFIAHCPVLELSSCGETFDAALASFHEALHLFLEECAERKTLEKVLPVDFQARLGAANRADSEVSAVAQQRKLEVVRTGR